MEICAVFSLIGTARYFGSAHVRLLSVLSITRLKIYSLLHVPAYGGQNRWADMSAGRASSFSEIVYLKQIPLFDPCFKSFDDEIIFL